MRCVVRLKRVVGYSALAGVVLGFGCTDRTALGEPESASSDSTGDAVDDAADGPDEDDEGESESDEGSSSTEGDDCGSELGGCEDLPHDSTCDFWAQDCPAGEKCTPVLSPPEEGSSYEEHRCVPFGSDAIGESCTLLEGPPGADSCGAQSMCLDVDPVTGFGRCNGYCLGPRSDPTCPADSDPLAECYQSGNGVLNVCFEGCNPLLSGECPADQVCVAAFKGEEIGGFICFPPSAEGTAGEQCSCANCCAAGHMCVSSEDYGPGCAFDACCTEYCDVSDTTFSCQGTDQVCVGFFDPSIPEFGNVGRCVVP